MNHCWNNSKSCEEKQLKCVSAKVKNSAGPFNVDFFILFSSFFEAMYTVWEQYRNKLEPCYFPPPKSNDWRTVGWLLRSNRHLFGCHQTAIRGQLLSYRANWVSFSLGPACAFNQTSVESDSSAVVGWTWRAGNLGCFLSCKTEILRVSLPFPGTVICLPFCLCVDGCGLQK